MTDKPSKTLIEQLKGELGPGPARILENLIFSFGYDEDSGGIYGIDQGGFYLTRQQFEELTEGLKQFFDYHGDAAIEESNATSEERRREKRPAGSLQPKRIREGGYVYLIQLENGLYKIGKAKNLTNRLQPFRVSFPMKWDVIHTFHAPDYSKAEEQLHARFADKRDIGEWFRLTPEDVTYIQSIQDDQL